MLRGRRIKAWGMLAAGLVVGLAIGGGLAVGVLLGQRGTAATSIPGLEDLRLKAMASHGSDTFAIATGPVDEDVEGLFTLDFLTGDLSCFVINPRNGAFGGMFKANVANVLSVERGKKPSYLIATGTINTAGSYSGARPAASLCYVVDANSGEVAAFTFPWAKAATTAGVAQATEMHWSASGKPAHWTYGSRLKNSVMTIFVNGEPRKLDRPATLAGLLEQLEIPVRGVAVEVNLQVVPRTRHAEHLLAEGDQLEIVSLVGGG